MGYYGLMNMNEYEGEVVEEENGLWVKMNELGEVIFEENEMVEKGGGMMKEKG